MKSKTVFYCTECGNESPKWAGRCSACGEWNTMVEGITEKSLKGKPVKSRMPGEQKARILDELDFEDEIRFSTGISEFDRVLGGGAVRGSLVLVGGAPGIGKSTLLLQICGHLTEEKILYVTGEESQRQLKMRAQRLNVSGGKLFALSETDMSEIRAAIEELKPTVVIIDSVQTMYNNELTSSPGSITQVKECTMEIMQLAKAKSFSAFIVGHVNKEGAIAGPKVLEHMVDCVLYFEGERGLSHRILRAAKNRFGSTNEIGVFEMLDTGLVSVENPSEMLLSGRPLNSPGTCVACVMEGTRPILAEVQALITTANAGISRRNTNGIDHNRAMLLLAVLEKRGGLHVGGLDAYINVIGGLYLDEPAADLATVLAIASSHKDMPIGGDLAAIGEVGLTGEIRSVSAITQRFSEVSRLGFKRCVVPAAIKPKLQKTEGLELIFVRNVREAILAVFG